MCITTNAKPILFTATKDIEVYKHIKCYKVSWLKIFHKTVYRSLICYFKYKKGKVYHTKLSEFEPYGDKFVSHAGFYSWSYPLNKANALFIIPKGAKYYKVCSFEATTDRETTYISDKIKFVEYYG